MLEKNATCFELNAMCKKEVYCTEEKDQEKDSLEKKSLQNEDSA